MFDEFRLLGTNADQRRIVVQTRSGSNLENFVGPSAGPVCHNHFNALRQRHPHWEVRKEACGVYNCAGMVWASRRASLPNPDDWRLILSEDGYRPLRNGESVAIGDIAVYIRRGGTEILHVGRVCRLDRLQVYGHSTQTHPRILSKLDLSSGEAIHAFDDVVLNGGEAFEVHILTDRL